VEEQAASARSYWIACTVTFVTFIVDWHIDVRMVTPLSAHSTDNWDPFPPIKLESV